MFPAECQPTRRFFLKASAALTASFSGMTIFPRASSAKDTGVSIVGPKEGYTPEIGTLTSMMAFMRQQVEMSVKGMTQEDLDFLLDSKANRIGALLMHLAATENFYQLNTFEGKAGKTLPASYGEKWGVAMELGEPARTAIKGHDLDYYLNMIRETRERTLAEFRKRDDKWLAAVDNDWGWGPTNNYCKWFHVTEHEANHNGQIKFLKSRLPGAKSPTE